MIWPKSYVQRLTAWVDLRKSCTALPLESALREINLWWQASPWRPYYLHWDDRQDWPDPWDLLQENIYCDIARALGILYTVRMLDRTDCADACMIGGDQGNLVLVQSGKYIINWNNQLVVNIASPKLSVTHTLEPAVLDRLLG